MKTLEERISLLIGEPLDQSEEEALNELVGAIAKKAAKGAVGLAGAWAAWRTLKASSSASRKCGVFAVGEKRQACIFRYKMDLLNKKANLIRRAASDCEGNVRCLKSVKNTLDKIIKQKQGLMKSYSKIKLKTRMAGSDRARSYKSGGLV